MPHVLAIDQGTTSTRAILFDRDRRPVSSAQRELRQIYPADGRVEHDAEAIWADTLGVCRDAVASAGIDMSRVAAIGIANQRETVVLWTRATGRPVHNAIVWQDRRTAETCRRLVKDGYEPAVRAKTGLVIDPYFSATKLAWLLDNVPGARAAARAGKLAFGTIDSFLVWRLTGGRVHATDATNAARTLLYDIAAGDWDDGLLALFDIPRAILPEVRDSSDRFGETDPSLLGRAVPISGVAGDQQAAAFGQACFSPGDLKSTYGTGCFALLNVGDRPVVPPNRLLGTVAYRVGGRTAYAVEGAIFAAGATVKWLRDGLGLIDDAARTSVLAGSLADNGGVYLVPAFAGLGAPYWDPDARAAIVGMGFDAGRAHLVRAALEAVAYQTRDLIEAMAALGGNPPSVVRVDGGMVVNDWLCQFLADIAGIAVERPVVTETTALGAASLAGLAEGVYGSFDDVARGWHLERRFEPRMEAAERARLYAGWNDAVRRTLTSRPLA